MNRVPRWRVLAAITVLVIFVWLIAAIAPVYYRNYQLSRYVGALPGHVATLRQSGEAPSDDSLRGWVESKASALNLPVKAENVHLSHSRDGAALERIGVRYVVRVHLPGYTVDLHFHPKAGI